MEEQLSLEGFDEVRLSTEADNLCYFRRQTDRMPSSRTRRASAAISRFPSLSEDGYAWPVMIYTLGRFSLQLKGEPADFGRKVPH